MKVKLLFFFSFVLASAVLVQHRAKLALSNKVEGSENSYCCIMRFLEKDFFMMTVFVAESILRYIKLVLNAFPAISEGLNFELFRRSTPPDPHTPPLVDSS